MAENDTWNEGIDLDQFATLSNVPKQTDGYGGPDRVKLLSMALDIDSDEISVVREGGYQGTLLFIFEVDGYIWLLKDSYGSCSNCDGLLAAERGGSYRDYTRGMIRNAYAFSTSNDAIRFLNDMANDNPGHEGSTFAYGWGPLVDDAVTKIEDR